MKSPELHESVRWRDEYGPMSEEAVRGLHLPNYRHRFSAQKYLAGTAFAGRARASTCYVIEGACEFTFGERSVVVDAGYVAALPAGDFTFRSSAQNGVVMVRVFELPFDVVVHRRDGIEYLEDNGIYASPRDWALGQTIYACQLPEEHHGITVWLRALCLAPEESKVARWFIQDLTQARPERHSFSSLKAACDDVRGAWLLPDCKRLSRGEAKRLLAASRKPGLSEERKLQILDEYLVYETAADIHEAIRTGELPVLDGAAIALIARSERPETFPRELEPLLEDWLVHDLKYVLNPYLREELRTYGHEVIVEGQIERAGLCPCCAYFAIDPGEEGTWDVCPVCFWENGGEGPNRMTLAQAKESFDALGAVEERFVAHLAPDRRRKYRRAWTQTP